MPQHSLQRGRYAFTVSVLFSNVRTDVCPTGWLVAWYSGRTLVFDRWTFPVLHSTYS